MYLESESPVAYQEAFEDVLRVFTTDPDWVTFFRLVLGKEGIVRQAFPTQDSLAAFEQSKEFEEIQHMLARLREKKEAPPAEDEPTRVITVRLPKCMHEALRDEAYAYHTSMNKLCISKLVQYIDGKLVPSDNGANGKKERSGDAEPAVEEAVS